MDRAGAAPAAAADRDVPAGGAAATGADARRDAGADASTSYGRFDLAVTPALRALLRDGASAEGGLPEELRTACKQHAASDRVPWRLAQALCERTRLPNSKQPPTFLHEAAADTTTTTNNNNNSTISSSGGTLFRSPPPRPARPPALEERLAKLQGALDDKRYAEMVADVTSEERRLAALSDGMFPTTRLQLSFGLHVIVTMGTAFALGYYGARYLAGGSDAVGALGGALGMAAALLLETTLFIVRANMPEPLDKKYGHLLAPNWKEATAAAAGKGPKAAAGAGPNKAAAAVGPKATAAAAWSKKNA